MNGTLRALAERALAESLPWRRAELHLLETAGAPRDDRTDALTDGPDPAEAATWGPERTLRPEVLRWLCTDPAATARVGADGLRVHGVRLEGPLDLSFALVPFPLVFSRCALLPGLILTRADLPHLTLSGCLVGPVRCDGLAAHGPVTFTDGTRVLGGVRLSGATVLGDLSLTGARLLNGGGVALAAAGLAVEGDVLLDAGFKALGSVRLIDATVSGHLDCRGGRFLNRGGVALACDRIQVGGSTYLDGGFKAYGAVRLLDARVMGATRGSASTDDARRLRAH